jgi:cytochrome c553
MRPLGTAVLLTLLVGASRATPSENANDLAALREEARAAMRPCGHCHDATEKSAIPSALRTFDLDQREWASALDPSKLGCMDERFEGLKVPEADRARVRRYLSAEWARRAALPPEVRDRERAP